jgi:hypothetical protein
MEGKMSKTHSTQATFFGRVCVYMYLFIYLYIKVKQSHYRPWGFQEVEAPRFQDNRHTKVLRLSTLYTGRLYPREIFLVLISVRRWVNSKAIVRPEGICKWKIPMIPSGIEPANFWLVAQCLNQLQHHRVPPLYMYIWLYIVNCNKFCKVRIEFLYNMYINFKLRILKILYSWTHLWHHEEDWIFCVVINEFCSNRAL